MVLLVGMKKLLFLLTLVFFLTPFSVNAAELLGGRNVYIGPDTTFDENIYVGAGKIDIRGNVNSDLVVFGGEVSVSNEVTGDLLIFGGNVNFQGKVIGDVRIVGGDIHIYGQIDGDLIILGGNVDLEEGMNLQGETIIVGGDIGVRGDSEMGIKIIAGNVKVNSKISGPIDITTQYLHLGENANIEGTLQYYAPQQFSEMNGAQVVGEVSFNEIKNFKEISFIKRAVVSFTSFWFILQFITTIIIAFILIYIFRVFSFGASHIAVHSFWKSLLVGILALVLVPTLILLFTLSLVALPIGLLLLLSLIFFSIISVALAGIFIGAWARNSFSKTKDFVVSFQSATVGIIFLTALQFIPILGSFIRTVLVIVALGATLRYIHRNILKRS